MDKLKITIGVGIGFRRDGTPIGIGELSDMTAWAKSVFLDRCGGYTIFNTQGGWREGQTDFVEPGLSFVAIIDVDSDGVIVVGNQHTCTPERLAVAIRDIFEQAAVLFESQYVTSKLI